MRDPNRINEILEVIRHQWVQRPNMRLCQLLLAAALKTGWLDNDLFYLEDRRLLRGLRDMWE